MRDRGVLRGVLKAFVAGVLGLGALVAPVTPNASAPTNAPRAVTNLAPFEHGTTVTLRFVLARGGARYARPPVRSDAPPSGPASGAVSGVAIASDVPIATRTSSPAAMRSPRFSGRVDATINAPAVKVASARSQGSPRIGTA